MRKIITPILMLICISIYSQKVTTLATLESGGDGMIVAPNGDLLVTSGSSNDFIYRVTKDGEVSRLVDGLRGPAGLAYDSKGNLYVSNYANSTISKIDPNMVVTEFASVLDGPRGLVMNKNDELFVSIFGADFSGTGAKILKVLPNGSKQIYASGSGLSAVIGVTMDEQNNIYATNFAGGIIYQINSNKQVRPIGEIESALLNQICYSDGYVYIPIVNGPVDIQGRIFRLNVDTKKMEHFAGIGGNIDKDGDLLEAGFNTLNSCAFSLTGDTLYVLDIATNKIRQITLKETTSSVDVKTPLELRVEQNFPNPFKSTTIIKFYLTKKEQVKLAVYDRKGRVVEEILNEYRGSGQHNVSFNSGKLPSGVYYYKLSTKYNEVTKKMILEK